MNDWMDGSDWVWMTLSMTVGIVVLAPSSTQQYGSPTETRGGNRRG